MMHTSNRPNTYYWHNSDEHENVKIRALVLLIIMSYLIVMLTIAAFRAIFTHPGRVPQEAFWNPIDKVLDTNVYVPTPGRAEGNTYGNT
jgi:hypothetical protein